MLPASFQLKQSILTEHSHFCPQRFLKRVAGAIDHGTRTLPSLVTISNPKSATVASIPKVKASELEPRHTAITGISELKVKSISNCEADFLEQKFFSNASGGHPSKVLQKSNKQPAHIST
jgi:hypothetical protein